MRPATAVPMARRKVLVPNVECSCEHMMMAMVVRG